MAAEIERVASLRGSSGQELLTQLLRLLGDARGATFEASASPPP